MTQTDPDQALGWLESLYSSSQPEAWVNLCLLSGSHLDIEWAQVSDLDSLRPIVDNFSQRGDVYFSVATRKRKLDRKDRGGADECLALPAFFCDVDIDDGTGAHKLAQLPRGEAEAIALIRRFPLLPSAVIWSGHGLQPFWLMAEPLEAITAAVMLNRWKLTWAKLATEANVHLDDVADLPRMMRLPGTPNRKGPEPVLAYYKAAVGRVYQLSDLDDCLLVPEPEPIRGKSYTKHLAGSRFNEEVSCEEVLTWAGCEVVARDDTGSHWHWPGASHQKSFTVYADGGCACWSQTATAVTGIPSGHSYDSFGLYTWLNFKGDFAAARAHLIATGWPEAGANGATTRASVGSAEALEAPKAGSATPKAVDWLWRGWLPLGKLVTLDGDPATGKSTLLVDLAARVTRGGLMPDGSQCDSPGAVILLAAEDDLEDTVLPRLLVAGADTDQVRYVRQMNTTDGVGRPVSLPMDVAALERLVEATGARLVIVDVFYEYLDGAVDSYKDPSVRQALHLLAAMAERAKVCVVLVRHITKGAAGGKAIHAGGGSIGVVGRARVGLMVGYHPDDESLRVLAPIKSNLAEMPRPLGFRLEPHDIYPCALVRWTGPVDVSANVLLRGPAQVPAEDPEAASQLAFCVQTLSEVVTNEWRWTDEVMADLEEWHFPKKTLERARAALEIESKQFPEDSITGHYRGWKMRKVQKDG